jgi:hypothetical protein
MALLELLHAATLDCLEGISRGRLGAGSVI